MANETVAKFIEIVSGEGTGEGTIETFAGTPTARAIRARLTRERRGGDRWAFARIDGERCSDEHLERALAETPEVTLTQIRELQIEAGLAGDEKMIAICEAAIAGDEQSRAECAEVIHDNEVAS